MSARGSQSARAVRTGAGRRAARTGLAAPARHGEGDSAGVAYRSSASRSLAREFLRAIGRNRLLDGARAVVAGVSGGADSTAMACLLAPLCRARGIRLVLAHLHHGIRGRAADGDAAFVRRLAVALRAEFHSARVDVPARARREGMSVEMAARAARHAFLAATARACGADRVALAHTLDDQAETLLLKLARGAGRGGLGGMSPDARIGALRIVRPLLGVARKRIEAFLRTERQPWREDATNRDARYLRNRIRRRVLPLLARQVNPRIREALARAADILRAEDAHLDALALRALRRCAGPEGLRVAGLVTAPSFLQGRVVLAWLRAAGVAERNLTYATVGRVVSLAGGKGGTRSVPVGGGRGVERVRGCLRFAEPPPAAPRPRRLVPPGAVEDPGAGLRFEVRRARGFDRRPEAGILTWPAEAYVDWARVEGRPLVWRAWRPGDRMRPLGAPGTARIHNLLVNRKVPRPDRRRVAVVECDGEILWLPGHRIAEGWQVRGPRAASARLRIAPFRLGRRGRA